MAKLSQLPLYRQVMREVLAEIQAGTWREDEALPSEIDLGARFGVSQGTVRKALDELVVEDVLQRRQGVGTFVTGVRDYLAEAGFSSLTGDGSMAPSFELLGCVKIHAGEALAEMLGLRRGATLWQVRRLIRLQGRLIGLEEMLLPEAQFPVLDVRRIRELKCNLRALCWLDFGVRLKDGDLRLRAVGASAAEAKLLQVELNEPLLQLVRLARDFEGRPQMWSVAWIRTEQVAFEPPPGGTG
ncbi:GntR family transcriptional regulator [Chitiniphilus shinanonensis]|uniref:GntR family transcriptional regulator n=1 Tax=Chitiniphilus shinanonensis TaxID=553088 RepID=A0ABQ6BMP6_9NEIS|nr:GntR family transcriptional regulator [Chitiniphilus shinanonensis]GLS03285.1 GntR family transcriptional regulator [Chitiniphilus shinanonensis]